MAFIGEDDGSFSACLAQFLSATEAAFERSQATLTSMLEEMRELRAESRQICRAFEEGVLQDLAAFSEAFGKKDEILPESQQGGFVSPIPEPQNINSATEISKHPVLGKISSQISRFVPHVLFKGLPTRTVDDFMEFAFDGSSRNTHLFDPGGIDCVKDCGGFDHTVSSSFARFQRWFLAIYTLSSVMKGLWLVYGESELASYGLSKDSMVFYLCVAYSTSLVLGPVLGVLSDLIGQKRICLLYCVLHFVVGVWKSITMSPSAWFANVCLSLAGLIYSFGFETWLVVEHEKQSQRNDSLNETFWLMTFLESASLIGGQVLANWLVDEDVQHGIALSATASLFLSVVAIICIIRTAKEPLKTLPLRDYSAAFYAYVLGDKRIWFLGTSQACLQFSTAVFWILWAPTIVADGREVNLGLIYPCFLGSRMLGSTAFPWLMSGQSLLRLEDCLVYVYAILGVVFSIVAYDYQEIRTLVVLFCLFHGFAGLVLPLLARLRTMYVPNELRGGMISLSQVPANAAILFCLIQRGYSHKIENSTMIALGAVSLFTASGCIYLLRRWGKSPHQDWHKL